MQIPSTSVSFGKAPGGVQPIHSDVARYLAFDYVERLSLEDQDRSIWLIYAYSIELIISPVL